jgi:predicted nucleic acid-binding protein
MCIVIDTNVFSRVFDKDNAEHAEYKSVREWIYDGKGKMVFGGTTYETENVRNSRRNRDLINNLDRAKKVHRANKADVDAHETRVKNRIKKRDFDDPHLAAIVCSSGCKLICTYDKNSLEYLKTPELYKGYTSKPKFYLSKRNLDLLVDKNIAGCCKPTKKLTKEQKELLGGS